MLLPGNGLAALAAVAVLAWLLLLIQRAYFTPLAKLPGPWYARFSNVVLKKHGIVGRRMYYIHQLHEKYGPIVRIAPNEIDVSDPAMYKEVHKIGSGFLKDPWYHSFRTGDTHDVFSMIDPKDHAERRKLFAPLWTNSALHANWESMVVEKARLAVSKIKRDALVGEANCFKYFTYMTTDVISHLAFGESLDMLKRESETQYNKDLETAVQVSGACAEFPILRKLLPLVPSQRVKDAMGADDRVQEYGRLAVTKAKGGGLTKENVFSRLIAQGEKNEGEGGRLTEYQIAFEAGGFIVAGSGTTAVTLTYLVWATLKDPAIQQALEHEVASLPDNYTDSHLESLPLLNATIDETLRLYGAAPGSLPRQTPPSGATLGGYFIPPKTTVSSQAYTLHRDENVYLSATTFRPSRFLDSSASSSSTKYIGPPRSSSSWAPFGAGTRTCLGVHLAKMELRHATAEFFRECRGARIADSMRDEDMEMVNYFLITPKANKCCVTLC